MTLDDAISHAERVANGCDGECSDEHRQLAEWLRELRQWKRLVGEVELDDYQVAIFRLYAERIGELIRILNHDWNIDASWDGLRRLWCVNLTEAGAMERVERDAENADLRYKAHVLEGGNRELKTLYDSVRASNDRLRELVETMRVDMREMLDIMIRSSDVWGYCRYYGERLDAAEGVMHEQGIEVGA